MKYRLLASYMLAISISLPFTLISQLAVAQSKNINCNSPQGFTFDQLMKKGYALDSKREYTRALRCFKEALSKKPNNGYAREAIRNMNSYLERAARAGFDHKLPPLGRTGSGVSRGNCFPNQKPPIPLLPPGTEAVLTTQSNPNFYFYIPPIKKHEKKEIEFVLRDDENITPKDSKPLYKQTFRLGSPEYTGNIQDGGILIVRIPNSQGLQLNKPYTWGLSLICDQEKRDEDLYTQGKIRQIEDLDLLAQLRLRKEVLYENLDLDAKLQESKEILDRVDIYSAGGFWIDALSSVADLRYRYPDDILVKEYWRDLLNVLKKDLKSRGADVDGFDDAVDKPFLDWKPTTSEQNISGLISLEPTVLQ